MAIGYWPDYTPGAKYGPCAEPCQHRDCAGLRQLNNAHPLCGGGCGKRMQTGEPFFFVDLKPVHVDCMEEPTTRPVV